ncbi:hypothetical protein GCM10027444_32000 [Actinopolyspora lacussalsi]
MPDRPNSDPSNTMSALMAPSKSAVFTPFQCLCKVLPPPPGFRTSFRGPATFDGDREPRTVSGDSRRPGAP